MVTGWLASYPGFCLPLRAYPRSKALKRGWGGDRTLLPPPFLRREPGDEATESLGMKLAGGVQAPSYHNNQDHKFSEGQASHAHICRITMLDQDN